MNPTPAASSTVGLGMPTTRSGLADVPALADGEALAKKDFTPRNDVRWCPGCGDYAILAAVQGFLPELGIRRENLVCISGIGCSSRFPYYLNTFGMHSIHGRAPSIATGLATTRPDLSVWVVTGDGDALSIGGNHLIHALRRNVNLTILLFNNQIYGLTKGQYSPTSQVGTVTKSTPVGSVDAPFNPVSLALGAEATFVARTMDSDRKHLQAVLKSAAAHRGSSLVEIYQNCPIFHEEAFSVLRTRDEAETRLLHMTPGEPLVFGPESAQRAVIADGLGASVVSVAELGDRTPMVHQPDAPDPTAAFALSRLDSPDLATVPVGVFRSVTRPTYDDHMRDHLAHATPATDTDLAALLEGADTWTVS